MIKKLAALSLAMTIQAILLSGCGAVQVNERMFAQAVDIRESSGIYTLAVQIWNSKTEDSDYRILSARGRSFSEAADNIAKENGQDLFFGHCQAIFTDESILGDAEKLLSLTDSRISVGCPVIYSKSSAILSMQKADSGKQAQTAADSLKLYSEDGIIKEFTLKNACEAARTGEPAIVPVYGSEVEGAAVLWKNRVYRLSLSEAEICNMMNGEKNAAVMSAAGRAELSGIKSSVYFQNSENGGSYRVNIAADCLMNGTANAEPAMYGSQTAQMLSGRTADFLQRAHREGFIYMLDGFENAPPPYEDVSFYVTAEISTG